MASNDDEDGVWLPPASTRSPLSHTQDTAWPSTHSELVVDENVSDNLAIDKRHLQTPLATLYQRCPTFIHDALVDLTIVVHDAATGAKGGDFERRDGMRALLQSPSPCTALSSPNAPTSSPACSPPA